MVGPASGPVVSGSAEYRRRFELLMLPHLAGMHRLAVKLMNDGPAAEDVVQETYLKAYRAFGSLRDPSRARSWLCRILSRLVIDRHRAREREVLIENVEDFDQFSLYERIWDEDPRPYSETPHDDFLAQFRDDEVRAALQALPDPYRIPLVLLYVEESACTYRGLAEVLGCPIGTVMSRLHRGRKLLERELWECAQRRGLVKTWHVRR